MKTNADMETAVSQSSHENGKVHVSIEICLFMLRVNHLNENQDVYGGGGGSRTRVRKCYWSRDYMLIRVHALGITQRRSRPPLRTDKKRLPLA